MTNNNQLTAEQFESDLANLLAKYNVTLKAEDYFHGYGNCVRGVRIVATGDNNINIDLGNSIGCNF